MRKGRYSFRGVIASCMLLTGSGFSLQYVEEDFLWYLGI